jgi:hypothetical protein
VKQFVSLTDQIIATPAAALIISIDYSAYFFSEPYLSIEVAIERVGSDSDGWGKFNKKNYRVTGRVRVNLIRVGSDFWLNIIRFFGFWVISGRAGSDFGFLVV